MYVCLYVCMYICLYACIIYVRMYVSISCLFVLCFWSAELWHSSDSLWYVVSQQRVVPLEVRTPLQEVDDSQVGLNAF